MPLPRRVLCVGAAVLTVANLGSCRSQGAKAAIETLDEAIARLAPARPAREITPVDEPTSYKLRYDLYVRGHNEGQVAGKGAQRRTLLDATHVLRAVVRPFNETGVVRRSLAFVREAGGGASRVSFVRPLPDDPRPRVYPPQVEPRGSRRIAGRWCARYRIDGDEHCIDAAGIILLTRTVNSLEVATEVTIGAETNDAAGLAAPLQRGFVEPDRGSIRPIDPDTAPGGATDYSLDAPPDGFDLVGRYAVVPLTGEVLKQSSRKVVAGIVDVYVSGGDAIVIERGGKLDKSDVGVEDIGALTDARDVDLGVLGAGQVGIGGVGPFGYREVRARPSRGRYVVVAGTLPQDALVAIARSLRPWPGTEMRFLDG